MNPSAFPRTYSLREAARFLGISESLAYKLARQNQFPARVIKIGQRRYVVVKDSLDRLLADDGQ